MRFSQLTAAAFVLTLVLIAAGCTDPEETPLGTVSEQTSPSTVAAQNTVTVSGQNLTVHFLDVGQGDSILLELDGKFMLTCRTREFQHWIM